MSSIYTEGMMGNIISTVKYIEFLGRSVILKLSSTEVSKDIESRSEELERMPNWKTSCLSLQHPLVYLLLFVLV